MFWSDFHSIQEVPSASVKTRGSIDPPRSSWQMNGVGPGGERPGGGGADGVPDALGRWGVTGHHGGEVEDVGAEPVDVRGPGVPGTAQPGRMGRASTGAVQWMKSVLVATGTLTGGGPGTPLVRGSSGLRRWSGRGLTGRLLRSPRCRERRGRPRDVGSPRPRASRPTVPGSGARRPGEAGGQPPGHPRPSRRPLCRRGRSGWLRRGRSRPGRGGARGDCVGHRSGARNPPGGPAALRSRIRRLNERPWRPARPARRSPRTGPRSAAGALGKTGGDLPLPWGRTGKCGGKAQDFAPRP